MERKIRIKQNLFGVGLTILLVTGLAGSQKRNENQYNWQKTVDQMSALHAAHKQHPNVKRLMKDIKPEEFLEVNNYFKILTHIRMDLGYELDYVYARGSLGSKPILYARKSSEPQLETLKNFAYHSRRHSRWPNNRYDYLEKVVVKGTLPGYFELVVLRIMGEQFYLTWHCLYNDITIICDQKKLPVFWTNVKDLPTGEEEIIPLEVREKAYKLDFTPQVYVQEDTVVVKVVVFTKWGGFIRETYHISLAFPHKIKKAEKEKLVHFDCGWCY